jgi:hypothetical protein
VLVDHLQQFDLAWANGAVSVEIDTQRQLRHSLAPSFVGEGSAQQPSVVGETPNLAARLQALAEPDAVVIAAGTRRLVGDLFEYRAISALVEVKGIAGAVPAWQVLGPSTVSSRFEALRGSALSPLIGRDEEIDLSLRRWARAKAGEGQVVLVSGEPGIGKSRIAAAGLGRRMRIWRSWRICCACRVRSGVSCRTSLRSARSGHWKRPFLLIE